MPKYPPTEQDKYRIYETSFDPMPPLITEKFLFIRIPKNGSCTIQKAVADEQLMIYYPGLDRCCRHEGLDYLSRFISSRLDTIAIVRNPFDRLLSVFFHQVRHGEVSSIDRRETNIEYYQDKLIWYLENHSSNLTTPQCEYIKIDGVVSVDQIWMFELGLGFIISLLNKRYKLSMATDNHENKYGAGFYTQNKKRFYTPTSIKLVQERYEEDFSVFGYSTRYML